mgnify:CR=1 FL=1
MGAQGGGGGFTRAFAGGLGLGSGGALHLGLLAHDELVERSLRFRSAFCIFSCMIIGLSGGGVAYRRSRRDGESIEIRGDGLTLLGQGTDFSQQQRLGH